MKSLLLTCFQKRRASSIALLLILGTALLTFWPGILMSDTSSRWTAIHVLKGVLHVGWSLDQWLAPTMTIFMLPFGLTDSIPLFTATQVAYLALAGLMWISLTSSERPLWIPLLFALPVVLLYTAFVVPDVWTLASLIVVIAILKSGERPLGDLALLLFFVSNLVLFGFRQNSLILFPFIAFLVIKRVSEARWERPLLLVLMAGAVFLIATVPQHLGFGTRTSSAAAPAWELVGMLRVANELNRPVDPGVTLEGIADTKAAIKVHSFETVDPLLWGEGAAVSTATILDHSDQLTSRWLSAIRQYPDLYVRMKLRTYECMIGLCDRYLQIHIYPQEPIPLIAGHVGAYLDKGGFGGAVMKLSEGMERAARLVFLPVFWFPVGCFVFLMQWRRYNAFDRLLIAGASIYMLSFFILNQAASFRYMFPAYVVYTAYQLRYIGFLCVALMNKVVPRAARPGNQTKL